MSKEEKLHPWGADERRSQYPYPKTQGEQSIVAREKRAGLYQEIDMAEYRRTHGITPEPSGHPPLYPSPFLSEEEGARIRKTQEDYIADRRRGREISQTLFDKLYAQQERRLI